MSFEPTINISLLLWFKSTFWGTQHTLNCTTKVALWHISNRFCFDVTIDHSNVSVFLPCLIQSKTPPFPFITMHHSLVLPQLDKTATEIFITTPSSTRSRSASERKHTSGNHVCWYMNCGTWMVLYMNGIWIIMYRSYLRHLRLL